MMARRAVESALAQTLGDLEIIVVDDGSLREPDLPSDPRIRAIRCDKPRGVCAARNTAIKEARGRWITFLDDDDELVPRMLEASLRVASDSGLPQPVAVLSSIEVVDAEGGVLEVRVPPRLPRGRHFFLEDITDFSFQTQNSLVAPVSLVRDIGGWDEGLMAMEHDDFFLRLNASASIEANPAVGYRLTAHDGPRLSRDLSARADAMKRVVDRHREAFRSHPRRFAEYLGTMGTTNLRAGRWTRAVAASTNALVRDPLRPHALRQWSMSLAGPRAWGLIDAGRRRLSTRVS